MSVFEDGKTAGVGHNSKKAKPASTVAGLDTSDVKSIIERIENLNADKADIAADIREVFAEAKAKGYDTKILREVIKRRKKAATELEEWDSQVSLYEGVFG